MTKKKTATKTKTPARKAAKPRAPARKPKTGDGPAKSRLVLSRSLAAFVEGAPSHSAVDRAAQARRAGRLTMHLSLMESAETIADNLEILRVFLEGIDAPLKVCNHAHAGYFAARDLAKRLGAPL